MKGLPPALRKRKRYIAFRLIVDSEINRKKVNDEKSKLEAKDVAMAVWQSLISLFGDYFSANSGLWLEEFDGEYGILRCNSDALDKVKVALTLTVRVSGMSVIPVILGVSGTIKKCRSKYIGGVSHAHAANGL
jgi:ribonuclease P/MRP protein subunit POP5